MTLGRLLVQKYDTEIADDIQQRHIGGRRPILSYVDEKKKSDNVVELCNKNTAEN